MKKERHILSDILIIGCVCALIFILFRLGSLYLEYRSGKREYDELRQLAFADDAGSDALPGEGKRFIFEALRSINPDLVGWIEIPGTAISYPFVHGSDDDYYLSHTFSMNENSAGSIFMEAENQPDFSDIYTVIYGHNMKNGSMFSGLNDYSSESFFQEHPCFYVYLEEGAYCYEIFSCHQAAVRSAVFTTGYEADNYFGSFVSALKEASLYDTGVEVGKDDKVITLSTCTKNGTVRFVIHGKLS